jgi:CheY-like chemotaxis protein
MADAPPRAVVVDDNLMFAMMVEPVLKRLGYHATTLPGNPTTAEEVAALAPEVVFVNLTSSRYSGADLVRDLRSRPALAKTGIVGYAGHVERHFFQAGRDAGADLVVPNSAIRAAIPQVLEKLKRRLSGAPVEEWPEGDEGVKG